MSEIVGALENADCLYSAAEVDVAIESMAQRIDAALNGRDPVVITLLIRHLNFPLQQDYMHLSRYRGNTVGGEIDWRKYPDTDLVGRTVLLVDDLLDHGITLGAALDYCVDAGAAEVQTAVLVFKQLENRSGLARVDYFGLATQDRYLFGSGMDYKSYWRNAPGIFAVP